MNMRNIGGFALDMVKEIPGYANKKAFIGGTKVGAFAAKHGASSNMTNYAATATFNGLRYGAIGVAGVGTIGAAIGMVRDDTSVIGGTASGMGLGAIGGAGAGAVAAAIAKSAR